MIEMLLLALQPLEAPDPTPRRPDATWLAGTWLRGATAEDRDRLACVGGTTFTFAPDGTTAFWEGRGTWRLHGDRLVETMTEASEDTADPDIRRAVGTRSVMRIVRVGPDEGVVVTANDRERMLRCSPADLR